MTGESNGEPTSEAMSTTTSHSVCPPTCRACALAMSGRNASFSKLMPCSVRSSRTRLSNRTPLRGSLDQNGARRT